MAAAEGTLDTGPARGVWSRAHRRLTLGLVLTITLVAFESLAISTVMPVVKDDLGGLALYGWVFSGFFLGSILGIVVAGRSADRRGTATPFAAGLAAFTVGLVAGGLAPSMGALVAARIVQGFGAGAIPAVAYASVGRAYPSEMRPRVFAVFSSAWVIPALVGPAAATAVTHAFGWRAVFLGLLPFVLVAAVITVPALTRTPPEGADGNEPVVALADGLLLTAGAGMVLVALGLGSPLAAAPLFVAGAALGSYAFLRLVPEGTLRARAGLPAAILVRGLLTFSFFGTDAYVSLVFQDERNQPTWVAGAALTTSTLCWTGAAWAQQRWIHSVGPRTLVRTGLGVLAAATAMMFGVLGSLPIPLSVLAWGIGGFGIGLAYSPLSVVVLGLAEPGREGARSASLQLCDVLGIVLGTGVVGAFVALGEAQAWATRSSLEIAFAITLLVAVIGAGASRRLPVRLAS